LTNLLHPITIAKLLFILGIPSFPTFFFVTVFLPIIPANEKVPTVTASQHNTCQAIERTVMVLL